MADTKTILMVCTGNTCRSPMAEGFAKHLIAQHLGITSDDLPARGYDIRSAGSFAYDGAPVSPESVQALQTHNIDIAAHTSSALTPDLIDKADLIYCMTDSHRQAVLSIAPQAAHKTHRLIPDQNVSDPIGMGLTAYLKTADMILAGLKNRLSEML
ncbi:Low molecular weight protein-tyrosine-phosphatase YwlE [Poriferisphaera corsica]|uniref:protein-tyrosine-phosphatase n=1 Tax=Poriferisphaera corsica TaxID=2528020 RepID=A0A517YSW4_9BACT|nr:low molecular weight protein arginine phosphatase [Poriferisphaera corsica]QDU33319.1 Low molecular weight protein-tyrosine-phosphatase YwlE [Poriferisphaera corsica]